MEMGTNLSQNQSNVLRPYLASNRGNQITSIQFLMQIGNVKLIHELLLTFSQHQFCNILCYNYFSYNDVIIVMMLVCMLRQDGSVHARHHGSVHARHQEVVTSYHLYNTLTPYHITHGYALAFFLATPFSAPRYGIQFEGPTQMRNC